MLPSHPPANACTALKVTSFEDRLCQKLLCLCAPYWQCLLMAGYAMFVTAALPWFGLQELQY